MAKPESIRVDFLTEKVEPLITKHGFAVQVVGGDNQSLPFAYTVGLSAKKLPEMLLIAPLDVQIFKHLVNAVARMLIA